MRDWSKTLFRSSYSGVPFWVDSDSVQGGRRLVIHELAGSDLASIEDFGAAANQYSVTAYLVGDTADTACAALVSALDAGLPGLLILPADGALTVYPQQWTRQRGKDRDGYFALDITFVAPMAEAGYALGIGLIASLFSAGVSAAASAFGSAF